MTLSRDHYTVMLKEHGSRLAETSISYLSRQRTLAMQGDSAIDTDACSQQIRHWMNVRLKKFIFEDLNCEERFTVMDAIDADPEIHKK